VVIVEKVRVSLPSVKEAASAGAETRAVAVSPEEVV
jgi:hypothetical protein